MIKSLYGFFVICLMIFAPIVTISGIWMWSSGSIDSSNNLVIGGQKLFLYGITAMVFTVIMMILPLWLKYIADKNSNH